MRGQAVRAGTHMMSFGLWHRRSRSVAPASCLAFAAAVVWLSPVALAAAQQPAPSGRAATGQAVAAVQEGYTYKPEGRRDPFVSLINRGTDGRQSKKRPEGVQGLIFSEIALRGIVQAPTGPLALVQGPDRTYILHVGDRLFDGVVKTITADSLVVVQEVNDPLSLAKQREVRKTLRVVEEVK